MFRYSYDLIQRNQINVFFQTCFADRFYEQQCCCRVARTIDNDNDENGKNITEEQEYRPLEHIADGYPKYLITMDKLLQKRNGIKHLNIVDMMLNDTDL